MSFFDTGRIAERKIQEAIEEGAFDDLPGKGQPIDLDDDPMTPPHLRLSNRVLKNAGVYVARVMLKGADVTPLTVTVRVVAPGETSDGICTLSCIGKTLGNT